MLWSQALFDQGVAVALSVWASLRASHCLTSLALLRTGHCHAASQMSSWLVLASSTACFRVVATWWCPRCRVCLQQAPSFGRSLYLQLAAFLIVLRRGSPLNHHVAGPRRERACACVHSAPRTCTKPVRVCATSRWLYVHILNKTPQSMEDSGGRPSV